MCGSSRIRYVRQRCSKYPTVIAASKKLPRLAGPRHAVRPSGCDDSRRTPHSTDTPSATVWSYAPANLSLLAKLPLHSTRIWPGTTASDLSAPGADSNDPRRSKSLRKSCSASAEREPRTLARMLDVATVSLVVTAVLIGCQATGALATMMSLTPT